MTGIAGRTRLAVHATHPMVANTAKPAFPPSGSASNHDKRVTDFSRQQKGSVGMIQAWFDTFLNFLEMKNIASRQQLVGCSPAEIEAIEGRYRIRLPESYRTYLELMGHKSGRLFTHDHLATRYKHVLKMTSEAKECPYQDEEGRDLQLPEDAFIILGRLGEQFHLIRCNDSTDSPIWYYSEYDFVIRQVSGSVLEWLQLWADEASESIERGYYDAFPEGTGDH